MSASDMMTSVIDSLVNHFNKRIEENCILACATFFDPTWLLEQHCTRKRTEGHYCWSVWNGCISATEWQTDRNNHRHVGRWRQSDLWRNWLQKCRFTVSGYAYNRSQTKHPRDNSGHQLRSIKHRRICVKLSKIASYSSDGKDNTVELKTWTLLNGQFKLRYINTVVCPNWPGST